MGGITYLIDLFQYLYGLYKGAPPRVLTKRNFRCNVKIPPKMPRYLKLGVKLLVPC